MNDAFESRATWVGKGKRIVMIMMMMVVRVWLLIK